MILICNSCDKKFVIPDNAITDSGRTVQCGSCGNKWKQFPPTGTNTVVTNFQSAKSKKIKETPLKTKKKKKKRSRDIDLYSPEYLAKKHGININDNNLQNREKSKGAKDKVYFGFYNSLIIFIFILIFFSRSLYFSQDFIIKMFPITEFYLNYFFESIQNIFEIAKNLILSY